MGGVREASKGGRDTSEEDLVLQVKNSELVYKLCIVMRKSPTECRAGERTGRECLECCAIGE